MKAVLEAGRQLNQLERAHMHGHLGSFEVAESGVEAGAGFRCHVSVGETLTEREGLGHWGLP